MSILKKTLSVVDINSESHIMNVRFWGTRGSIAVPGKETIMYGGNTTCLEMTLESGKKIIIDAGTGIRALGNKLLAEKEPINVHLLITHIHWDHILGFPFFKPIYDKRTRVHLIGCPLVQGDIKKLIARSMSPPYFPFHFDELLDVLIQRDPSRLGVNVYKRMIKEGDAGRLADMMIHESRIFPAFLEVLPHIEWSVRLGAMVVAEDIFAREPALAEQILEPLYGKMDALNDAVKGDMIYLFGESADKVWIPKLKDLSDRTSSTAS